MMIFHTQRIPVASKKPIELVDITDNVKIILRESRLSKGFVVVSTRHTTSAIRVNESCGALEKDLEAFLPRLVDTHFPYEHNKVAMGVGGDGRPNAHSHLLGYLMGASETITVGNGALLLGQWQRIFFVELDGPRPSREVQVTVVGE